MGTPSMIGCFNDETGTVTATYCHYDGYLEYNGKMLVENYNTPERAEAVANAGYLSALEEDLNKSIAESIHTGKPVVYKSVEDYQQSGYDHASAHYLYLFDGENWFFASRGGERRFEEVEMNLQ